ncbi:MoaD/ThiS family protein [Roseimaritima ulvae]|uniref:Sulfur carrier protein CysO n=1 Tax=Roseimaritima ulvae TaxID=980254 RepID=A0A5B9QNK8_9BACT|nr:MoaD/ThiS family protein [Roseimaritima ulvae]QEG39240.1 Sulfur carrier protein CysO [Roseimaritima ulvae]
MKVIIPTSLRQHTEGQGVVDVQGQTLEDALSSLVDAYPTLKPQLLEPSGQLVSHVNIFINDTNVRDLDDGGASLAASDEILLVPAIAGG